MKASGRRSPGGNEAKAILMLDIKPILPDHWPLLKDIRLRALADAPGAFGTTLAEAQAYSDAEWQTRTKRFMAAPPAIGCLASLDAAACGLACAFPSAENTHAAGLTAFWVAPEHRGQGVADAMVTFLVKWAAAQGFAVLEADVFEDNHRAIAFYKKIGFEETGQSGPSRRDPPKRIVRLAKKLTI
jgi:ribosomal protein S18 acetylase RimI-like enzyme